jgi:hypothetical protein
LGEVVEEGAEDFIWKQEATFARYGLVRATTEREPGLVSRWVRPKSC